MFVYFRQTLSTCGAFSAKNRENPYILQSRSPQITLIVYH